MLIMVFAVQLGWLPASGRGETRTCWACLVSFLTLGRLRTCCCRR
jgi:peptide/nickel transport system permease protein